jgi:hypothetical protein
MRLAPADALKKEAIPVLRAKIPEDRLKKLFPVVLEDMDPWSAAEPSKGALVRFSSGRLVVLTHGTRTQTLEISLPKGSTSGAQIDEVLSEAPIEPSEIEWRVDRYKGSKRTTGVPLKKPGASLSRNLRVLHTRAGSVTQYVKRDSATGHFTARKVAAKASKVHRHK